MQVREELELIISVWGEGDTFNDNDSSTLRISHHTSCRWLQLTDDCILARKCCFSSSELSISEVSEREVWKFGRGGAHGHGMVGCIEIEVAYCCIGR